MSFIGKLCLQYVRSNLQRQTKKKMFDVSLRSESFAIKFLTPDVRWNEKMHFYSRNQNPSSVIRIKISTFFYCETRVSVGERGAKIGVENFLDNRRMTHPKIRCTLAFSSVAEAFAKPILKTTL